MLAATCANFDKALSRDSNVCMPCPALFMDMLVYVLILSPSHMPMHVSAASDIQLIRFAFAHPCQPRASYNRRKPIVSDK